MKIVLAITTEINNVQHVIFNCPNFTEQRNELEHCAILEGYNWPCRESDFIFNKKLFHSLCTYLSNTNALAPSFN